MRDRASTPTPNDPQSVSANGRAPTSNSKPLYRKLRPGPHGRERSREQVLRNQRTRLLGAMIEAVAERGYNGVSVTQVVQLAGVSKRTFYEHFKDKQDCFLTTFDAVSLEAMKRLVAAYAKHPDRDERLRVLLEWSLTNVAKRPKEARLRMIEAFAAGPAAQARVRRMRATIEGVAAASLPRREHNPPPIVVKGIAHGLWHIISSRLLRGDAEQLPPLSEGLYDWMTSYRCPPGTFEEVPLASGWEVAVSPKPLHGDERRRLQYAALRIAGQRGWPELSWPALLELACVERSVAEDLYEDVEACFMDALDLLAAEALAPMLAAARAAGDWPAGVCAAMRALTSMLARDPAFARAAFVESACVGPRGVERGGMLLDGFAALLRRYAPDGCRLSETASQAIVGALWGVLHDYVHARASSRLRELAPHLAYIVLAPIVGPQRAIEHIRESSAHALPARGRVGFPHDPQPAAGARDPREQDRRGDGAE